MPGINLPSRRLVSQQDQAMIARPDVPRSRFTGSWKRLMTFDAGYLYPFLVDEILPGDHMKYDAAVYARLSTPLFPIFSGQRVDTHFFFVPCRLLWSNWKRFMGQQDDPTSPPPSSYTIPQVVSAAGGFVENTIYDHMGLPCTRQVDNAGVMRVSALPFRAYLLVYLEWFRDENLIAVGGPITGDGPDAVGTYALYQRGKSHDYFTSCLPWPQKFTAPAALGSQAPVVGVGIASPPAVGGVAGGLTLGTPSPGQIGGLFTPAFQTSGADPLIATTIGAGNSPLQIFADLSAITVNTLRQGFLVQQLLERDARGGTRYTELVRAHFGVSSPDARMQRPEYIGGGSSPLSVTPIAQTAPAAPLTVGALGAAGTVAGQHRASYASTEHGYVIGIISVRSELAYQQGVHRMWTRQAREDFYFPSLAGLGEQAVLRREIYARTDAAGWSANDLLVFGYQERFHEYRTRTSEVTGEFKGGTDVAGPLEAWHLVQRFIGAPTLGGTFINDTPPMARVLAAGAAAANQQYLADILIRREAVRPIPTYGTPVTLGRF